MEGKPRCWRISRGLSQSATNLGRLRDGMDIQRRGREFLAETSRIAQKSKGKSRSGGVTVKQFPHHKGKSPATAPRWRCKDVECLCCFEKPTLSLKNLSVIFPDAMIKKKIRERNSERPVSRMSPHRYVKASISRRSVGVQKRGAGLSLIFLGGNWREVLSWRECRDSQRGEIGIQRQLYSMVTPPS